VRVEDVVGRRGGGERESSNSKQNINDLFTFCTSETNGRRAEGVQTAEASIPVCDDIKLNSALDVGGCADDVDASDRADDADDVHAGNRADDTDDVEAGGHAGDADDVHAGHRANDINAGSHRY